jgi:carbamoyl-phosphate synthase large subunit
VLGAGSGPGNNLIRSLKAGVPSSFIAGCHDDRFFLKRSLAARNYLVPLVTHSAYERALCAVIEAARIDLVIPNCEADVAAISNLRHRLPCHVYLPPHAVVEFCQDKYELAQFLRKRGIPVAKTYPIGALNEIPRLFRRLPRPSRLWCRIRKGAGSIGAIPVANPAQARSWIKYWQEMRGIATGSFTLSEYLPGRDYCLQCLWKDGRLILSKMHEKLVYFVAGSNASGVSSSAAVAKIAYNARILRICSKAILALDRNATGIFFVDLKENAHGVPCVTEINAGRFANIPTIHDVVARNNMAATYVRLALGERVRLRGAHEPAGRGHFVLRNIDTAPAVFGAAEFYVGIEDATAWHREPRGAARR